MEATTMAVLAQQGQYMWYGNGHMMGMHWGWWIFWLIVLVFLIWFVLRTTGSGAASGPSAPPPPAPPTPEEVLRDRLARGEITEEEFRQRMRVLRESEQG
jgi:putative membrane protein